MIPAGWKLVPIEPTEAMLVSGLRDLDPIGRLIDWDRAKGDCATRDDARSLYAQMLTAAPDTPNTPVVVSDADLVIHDLKSMLRMRDAQVAAFLPFVDAAESAMDMVLHAYKHWPEDIRKKLSLHDLRRMSGWVPSNIKGQANE